jgi:hypothetical protein
VLQFLRSKERFIAQKPRDAEEYLDAQAEGFAQANAEEKSACSARNDKQ